MLVYGVVFKSTFSSYSFKHQVIPYFLANYVETSSYPRRIYIDLGIQDFESSLCWMMQHYPVKFDHIYGFECARDFSDVNNLAPNVERCINGTSAESTGYLDVPKTVGSMSLYYNYVGLDDDPATSPPTVGLSGFLRDMGLAEEDFVVMKMDVEGLEYDLIERMLDDGTYTLIDEVSSRGFDHFLWRGHQLHFDLVHAIFFLN